MRLSRALSPLALLLAAPAAAHDFWIEPDAFRAESGMPVALRFLVGEPGAVEHWSTEWRKIVSLQDFGPDGVTDLAASIRPANPPETPLEAVDATVSLAGAGTHVLAFVSNHAVSDLPAAEFEDYARHEGLAHLIGLRAAAGKSAANGRELYSRRAKALIQIGPRATDSVSRPIGQTLEIVPLTNPALLASGTPLRLRVLFHGAPLAGASVVLEALGPEAKHGEPQITDAKGEVSFTADRTGSWKAATIWSYPIEDPRADYETIFSTLTFGF